MSVINGNALLAKAPIKNMETTKIKIHGVSYGLGEVGYDVRVKQNIMFTHKDQPITWVDGKFQLGRFCLASCIEEFEMPNDLVGIVYNKSTWARQGVSIPQVVIEPGWKGFLTLGITFHYNEQVLIHAGSGIAQIIFTPLVQDASYEGKYQNQENMPVTSIFN